jgi:hypothetical protein
VRPDRS